MAALVMVLLAGLRMGASVPEPTRLMPPHSPDGKGEGHDCTNTDGQLLLLALSRSLAQTFRAEPRVSRASSAAPGRLQGNLLSCVRGRFGPFSSTQNEAAR